MNNSGYIVNPIWFWLISIVEDIDFFVSFILGFSVFAIFIMSIIIFFIYIESGQGFREYIGKYKIILRRLFICFIVTAVIAILVPSRQDMEKIIIFSKLTEENVTAATDYGKDLVDYVFDKINETTKENE